MSTATELLRRALEHLDLAYKHGKDLDKDIRAFLAAEPEAEPGNGWHLREVYFEDGEPMMHREPPKPAEPEAEPVAWMRKWYFDGEIPQKEKNERGRMAWPNKFKFLPISCHKCCEDDIPLYTRSEPAARKPMTEEEMKEAWGQPGHLSTAVLVAYTRAVERHHGIGGSDGNHK